MKLWYYRAGALATLVIPDALGEAWGVKDGESVPTREAYQLRRLTPIADTALNFVTYAESIAAAGNLPDEPPALEDIWR